MLDVTIIFVLKHFAVVIDITNKMNFILSCQGKFRFEYNED